MNGEGRHVNRWYPARLPALCAIFLMFSVLGVHYLRSGHAATPVIPIETESGTVKAPAVVLSDASASGAKAVKFVQPPAGGTDPTIAVVGDIALGGGGEYETAALVERNKDISTVLAAGDLAYQSGTTSEWANNWDPSWGPLDKMIKPSPGNHDYITNNGAPYYAYWGNISRYYSFDIGAWHIISLNSQEPHYQGSAQDNWLRSDLAAHTNKCTLAYEHYPRFSSDDQHGDDSGMQRLWQDMYDAGGDVFVAGHAHTYERFAPQTPDGQADSSRGITSWVVGTGGAEFYTASGERNTVKFINGHYGVLKLTLHAGSYDFKFVDTDNNVLDSGSGACH